MAQPYGSSGPTMAAHGALIDEVRVATLRHYVDAIVFGFRGDNAATFMNRSSQIHIGDAQGSWS